MISAISNAVDIFRERGLQFLLYSVLEIFVSILNKIIALIIDSYWEVKGGYQSLTVNNITIDIPATKNRGGPIFRKQIFEEYQILENFTDNIESTDIFYDVGANLGLYSAFAEKKCEHVVAFEPHPANFKELEHTLRNQKVDLYQLALSDQNTSTTITGSEKSVGFETGTIGKGNIDIESVRGDRIISEQNLKMPDVIKIDVEGHEFEVLTGIENALRSCRRIYIEIHLPTPQRANQDLTYSNVFEVLDKLSELNFGIENIIPRRDELFVIANRKQSQTCTDTGGQGIE